MLRLLRVLAFDPKSESGGLALAKDAGVRSPGVYRALARLEATGWVTSRPEDFPLAACGRPRRRVYRLTPYGASQAVRLLAKHDGRDVRPTPNVGPWRQRPRGALV